MAYFSHISFSSILIPIALIFLFAIPSSICQSQNEVNLDHICSKTFNSSECLNQFKSDPRSSNADIKGLTVIAADLALNKANTVHTQYNELYRETKEVTLQDKYISCSKNYNDAIRDLQLVKKYLDINRYKFISVEINDALQELFSCTHAFKRDAIDPAGMDYQNKEFKLLCYMVKVTSNILIGR